MSIADRIIELKQEIRDLQNRLVFEKDPELAALQASLVMTLEIRIRQLKEIA